MIFQSKRKKLLQLIRSFEPHMGSQRITDLEDYVDHGEPALAIETLSDWIYELNIPVSADSEEIILDCSKDCNVESSYHAWIGRTPPYPDLRIPKQITNLK